MRRTNLGSQGLEVSAQGLGCMGMTWAYGGGDEQSGLETIHRALELGVTREAPPTRPITPAQLALAWVHAKGEDIVPIPGTKRPERLEENAAASEIELSEKDVAELDQAVPADAVVGGRYREAEMELISG